MHSNALISKCDSILGEQDNKYSVSVGIWINGRKITARYW